MKKAFKFIVIVAVIATFCQVSLGQETNDAPEEVATLNNTTPEQNSRIVCGEKQILVAGVCCEQCFGKPSSHYQVCSSHGICKGFNDCQCSGKWGGGECNECVEGHELVFDECLPRCPPGKKRWRKDCVPECEQGLQLVDKECLPICCEKTSKDPDVCSGNGRCIAPGMCDCNDGFTGTCCNMPDNTTCPDGYTLVEKKCVPVCCDKPASDNSVCSGKGRCVLPNVCICEYNRKGNCCEEEIPPQCPAGYTRDGSGNCIPLCCGKNSSDPQVCSGYGRCIAPGVCQCNGGYSGECCDRSTPTCDPGYQLINGVCHPLCCNLAANDPNVCRGRGTCVLPNICRCNVNFTGGCCEQECQTCPVGFSLNNVTSQCEPVCCGYPSSDSRTCGGKGVCQAPSQCQCNGGFFGSCCGNTIPTCDPGYQLINGVCIPLCCNMPANDANVCGGHGQCVAPNVCQCYANWTGTCCSQFVPPTCGIGYTLINGACVPTCCNVPSTDPAVCSGRGSCIAPNTCQCIGGFNGSCCESVIPPTCNSGYHLVNGTCLPVCCGVLCLDPNVCSGHGQCIAPNTCQCQGGFAGTCCDTIIPPTCNSGYQLVNGNCVPICCNLPATDAAVCSGRGRCVAPNQCECFAGCNGTCCENIIPPPQSCNTGYQLVNGICQPICCNLPATDSNTCSGRGRCVAPNTCQCNGGFNGSCCESVIPPTCNVGYISENGICIPLCYGVIGNRPNVCSGHGRCISLDSCQCDLNFSGLQCESSNCLLPWTCYNYSYSDLASCSGNGLCIAQDTCKCKIGYSGAQCEVNSNTVAPSNCDVGYSGLNCSIPICHGVSGDDSDVCSGNGNCLRPDVCSCLEGFEGSDCSRLSDDTSDATRLANSAVIMVVMLISMVLGYVIVMQ